MELLSTDEIAKRVAALKGPIPSVSDHSLVRPLTAAAESLLTALRIEDGIGLGLADIDVLTRGFRPTDLVIVTGFAHSAKTQLINTMVLNSPEKRVLFFSLDDPAEMILAKLVAMHTGIPSEEMERRVREGDPAAHAAIRDAASDTFRNLLVVDDVIGINRMQEAVAEATELWGSPPDAVVIDYLEMLPGNATADDELATVKAKANDLKKWAKRADFPLVVVHQGTRSNARPGEPITLLSMGHSGEQQATIVIGCRRKRDRGDLDAWERVHHENTVTVHVVKCKRPGGRCTHYEGVDFRLESETGLIRPLGEMERRQLLDPNSASSRAERIYQGALAVGGSSGSQANVVGRLADPAPFAGSRDDMQLRGAAA